MAAIDDSPRAVVRAALLALTRSLRTQLEHQRALAADGVPLPTPQLDPGLVARAVISRRSSTSTSAAATAAVVNRVAAAVDATAAPAPAAAEVAVATTAAAPAAAAPAASAEIEPGMSAVEVARANVAAALGLEPRKKKKAVEEEVDTGPAPSTLKQFALLAEEAEPTPIAEIPPDQRPPSLDAVRKRLGACTRCKLHKGRRNIVFGVGNPQARLMLIGEGPGEQEDVRGEPFVGQAGELLDKIIKAMGLSREAIYIANVVKCRPPGNRDPDPEEVASCEPFLTDQITVVQPEVIVTLGRVASHALLKLRTPITRLRGNWREFRGIPVMPTLHPAYLLRTPAAKRLVWQDVQQVMARLTPR